MDSKVIHNHKLTLEKVIPNRHSEIKYLLPSQVIFLLTMHDVESMRSTKGLPSSLPTYFANASLNTHESLSSCMDSVVDKVGKFVISRFFFIY